MSNTCGRTCCSCRAVEALFAVTALHPKLHPQPKAGHLRHSHTSLLSLVKWRISHWPPFSHVLLTRTRMIQSRSRGEAMALAVEEVAVAVVVEGPAPLLAGGQAGQVEGQVA